MLKVIFPILSFLLLEASKTESENGVIINSVKLKYNPADAGGIKEGSNITLTCSVDILTPSGQSPQISYLFYKGQTQDVLLKIVTIQAQESQYLIQSARPSHSGYYSCEVAAGSQREESASTFITVTGNLQTPVLTVHPIEVILGDLTELCCTSEEIPPLTFIFYTYKNGLNPVRLHENSSKNKTVTHQLRVTTDTEKNYSCTIEVPAARSVSKHSEVVQLSVQNPFSDPMFEIEPSNEIFEGDKLTIKCRVTHLLPHVKPQLIIMKDTTPISTGNTSSVVFSKTANATDTGKYGCMARWNSVSQAIRRQVTVAVPVSIPTLMSTPIGGNVVEDGSLDLSCAVLGGSYPITYKFYQDTSEIPLHQITLNATTAVHHIVSVKNGHSGKYSCEVSNSANQITRTKKSQYVTIIVRVPVSNPTIKCNSLKDVYKTGEWVILLCQSTNGTVPITYSLFSNKRLIYLISRSDREPATFKVLLNETKDGGEYKCKAENEIPNLSKYSKGINITIKVPVSKPLIYPLLNSTKVKLGETVTLHCVTSTGTLPITYTLYRNQSSLQSATTMQAIPAGFNITVDSVEHSGVYSCKAENQISSEHSGGFLWWIYIIIVVISLMIIGLAILIAQHCKQWCKNNEGINQEDESSKPSQRGPLQHNQGSLKKSMEVIYSKIGNITHPKLNQPDSDMLIEQQEADSDRNHEGDYTNIMSYQGNVTEDDSESDCEADYTNVTSKRKAASADSDTSSDETNHVLYTQLDLAALQNNSTPQPQGPTIYASIALDKLR
ncbi:platelet endothelial cell adhesion molecule-like isoform X2 [Chiloscyllium plagiosum]|uniref:platelet endothelial cell adhesion molecule-like isoform X2 n=1 Tax=Chiloscyllium plagiosum TaxID=36176 RepID=UPI001CB7FF99|nr:platelet endothelial cell adhesion molecule-like isoform X2 [Chiloscyllium plagiosum]